LDRAECYAAEWFIIFGIGKRESASEEKDTAVGGAVEAWKCGKLGGEGLESEVKAVG
jgi:hypothetical protein